MLLCGHQKHLGSCFDLSVYPVKLSPSCACLFWDQSSERFITFKRTNCHITKFNVVVRHTAILVAIRVCNVVHIVMCKNRCTQG